MTRQRVLAVLVALFSAGWLFPFWLGVETYLSFWQVEAWPLIAGQHPGNSFPFIQFARDCFKWAFLWLGTVLAFWSYTGFSAFTRRRAA